MKACCFVRLESRCPLSLLLHIDQALHPTTNGASFWILQLQPQLLPPAAAEICLSEIVRAI